MKLWEPVTTCLFLLSTVVASPSLRHRRRSAARRARAADAHELRDSAPESESLFAHEPATKTNTETEAISVVKEFSMAELRPDQFEDVVDFVRVTISRIRRSSSLQPATATQRREKRRGGGRGGESGKNRRKGGGGGRRGGRGQGCVLKQVHLNVSDLGLGYKTSEEMIFKYCSGPCRNSETNYDRILNNLTHNRKLLPQTPPSHACCRPIAFDDDIAFLDDNLIYHTMKKHSARKCGCI